MTFSLHQGGVVRSSQIIHTQSSNKQALAPILDTYIASGRGARVSACAGLVNQLQSCWFNPRIACLENTDTVIVGDRWMGVGGDHALN